MTSDKISAKGGSTAVGGDNLGSILTVTAEEGATVNVNLEHSVARQLPTILGAVVVQFSQECLSEYGQGERRNLPPEVIEKIKFNCLPQNHRVLRDYQRHLLVLEKCYQGVEQRNADARYLVRRKAGVVYEETLSAACQAASVPEAEKLVFVRQHAASLVSAVVDRLLKSFRPPVATPVLEETAHLAISLIVADAVIECEVLERTPNAVAT